MFEIFFDYGWNIINFFTRIYQKYLIGEDPRCAWLTLICNDEYLIGVLALARSLKRVKTMYPLVVMVLEDNVSKKIQEQIINEGCLIRHVQGLYPEQDTSSLAYKRFVFVWTKLRAFEMVDVADTPR